MFTLLVEPAAPCTTIEEVMHTPLKTDRFPLLVQLNCFQKEPSSFLTHAAGLVMCETRRRHTVLHKQSKRAWGVWQDGKRFQNITGK